VILSPSLRKLTLATHVTASVGWVGALTVFLAHAIASVASQDALIVRSACIAMGVTAWFVIFPLSIASLLTGIIQALGSAWGLIRHDWVLAKLLLTVLATVVLLLKLPPIGGLADAAMQGAFSRDDLIGLRVSVLVHAIGGLLVLLTATTLAIYKPAGLTPFGVRRLRERSGAGGGADLPAVAIVPLWVRVFAAAGFLLLMMVGIMMLAGSHGPGAHLS
jgi:hypothetical protein